MSLKPGNTVGIDLGTSYSAIATLNSKGDPVLLKNSHDDEITSSVIMLEPGCRITVGPSIDRIVVEPQNAIVAIKRHMGDPDFFRMYEGRRLNAEFLSSMILKKLKQDAERSIGKVANAVITVPYYFNDPCRRATLNAGKIAELNVLDIINEPTAATLAYAWLKGELGRTKEGSFERSILVYDLGGGTFDVTVVKYTPTHFTVVATDGDTLLGGLDWTERIIEYAAMRFQKRHGTDPRTDPQTRALLTKECEAAKRVLSESPRTTLDVTDGVRTMTVGLERSQMEDVTADLLQRTRDTTEIVLELSGLSPDQIDDIVLVGGSTHMVSVVEMLKSVVGRTPSHGLEPQRVVAQGAAIHAAILEAREGGTDSPLGAAVLERLKSVSTTDVNSHSLGVEISDPQSRQKRNHIMIPRNSGLPVEVRQRFVTDTPNPQGIRVRLLEGEVSDIDACTRIGDFRISNLPPDLPVGSPVEVTYSYDASRRIHVTAQELIGNNDASVDIQWDTGMNSSAIEQFQTLARDYMVE